MSGDAQVVREEAARLFLDVVEVLSATQLQVTALRDGAEDEYERMSSVVHTRMARLLDRLGAFLGEERDGHD